MFDPKKASVEGFLGQVRILGEGEWSDNAMAKQAMSRIQSADYDLKRLLPRGPLTMEGIEQAFHRYYEPEGQRRAYELDFTSYKRDMLKQTANEYARQLRRKAVLAYPEDTPRQLDRKVNLTFIDGQVDHIKSVLTLIPGHDTLDIEQLCTSVASHEAVMKASRTEKVGAKPVREVHVETYSEEEFSDEEVGDDPEVAQVNPRRPRRRVKEGARETPAIQALTKQMLECHKQMAQVAQAIPAQLAAVAAQTAGSPSYAAPQEMANLHLGGPPSADEMSHRVNVLEAAEMQYNQGILSVNSLTGCEDPILVAAFQATGRRPPGRGPMTCFVCDAPGHMWRDCGFRAQVKEMIRKAKTDPRYAMPAPVRNPSPAATAAPNPAASGNTLAALNSNGTL
jgi:hypothetical protein